MILFRTRIFWGALCVFLLCCGSVLAGDNDADLFDELEGSETATQEPSTARDNDSPWFSGLLDHFEGSLRLRYHRFFDTVDSSVECDNSKDVGEGLFRFETFTGTTSFHLHTSGWAEVGTQDDTYRDISNRMQDKEYYRRYLEVNELYAVYSGESTDFSLGKKKFTTGICTLISPSDRFRPMEMSDPMDPKQLGIWQARADYYHDTTRVEFAILPVPQRNKEPSPLSRWWGERSDDVATLIPFLPLLQANETVEREYPDISWDNIGYFLKAKTTLSGWDLFLSMDTGPNPYTVIKSKGDGYVEKNIRVYSAAGGFSTTLGKFEFHGEALYNLSQDNRDDDYISWAAGITYTLNEGASLVGMEQIVLTIEYANEIITDRQSAENYVQSSKKGRPGRDDLLARIKLKYSESLQFENLHHQQMAEDSWMNRFEISYRLMDGLTLACALEIFKGETEEETSSDSNSFDNISYAQWDKNDRVVTSLTYEF